MSVDSYQLPVFLLISRLVSVVVRRSRSRRVPHLPQSPVPNTSPQDTGHAIASCFNLTLEIIAGKKMNQQLVAILVFAFLVLFILSPFSALAALMLLVLLSSLFFLLTNLFRVIVFGADNK
ncbi:MAG TPA: hypothetical protein V6D25_08630 [Leptolyngbyaceae cyanobacterium]